jgi:hypothetical protein
MFQSEAPDPTRNLISVLGREKRRVLHLGGITAQGVLS